MSDKSEHSENDIDEGDDPSFGTDEDYDEEDEALSEISDSELNDVVRSGESSGKRRKLSAMKKVKTLSDEAPKTEALQINQPQESSMIQHSLDVKDDSKDSADKKTREPQLKERSRNRSMASLAKDPEELTKDAEYSQSGRRKRKCVLNQQQRLSLLSQIDSSPEESPVYDERSRSGARYHENVGRGGGRRGRPSKFTKPIPISSARNTRGNAPNGFPEPAMRDYSGMTMNRPHAGASVLRIFNTSLANAASKMVLEGKCKRITDLHCQIPFPNNRIMYDEDISMIGMPPQGFSHVYPRGMSSIPVQSGIPSGYMSNHSMYRQPQPSSQHQSRSGSSLPPLGVPYRPSNMAGPSSDSNMRSCEPNSASIMNGQFMPQLAQGNSASMQGSRIPSITQPHISSYVPQQGPSINSNMMQMNGVPTTQMMQSSMSDIRGNMRKQPSQQDNSLPISSYSGSSSIGSSAMGSSSTVMRPGYPGQDSNFSQSGSSVSNSDMYNVPNNSGQRMNADHSSGPIQQVHHSGVKQSSDTRVQSNISLPPQTDTPPIMNNQNGFQSFSQSIGDIRSSNTSSDTQSVNRSGYRTINSPMMMMMDSLQQSSSMHMKSVRQDDRSQNQNKIGSE